MALLSLSTGAAASTITVPGNQPTIQAGINAASPGDTVLVAPGTYYESIDFQGKAITVTSSGGASVTIIDGSGTANPIVLFHRGETAKSVLSGFTVQNDGPTAQVGAYQPSGAIFIDGASPIIQKNVITQNVCSGIYSLYGSPTILNNEISYTTSPGVYCSTNAYGEGISINFGSGTIGSNTIEQNRAGLSIDDVTGVVIENNTIRNNKSDGIYFTNTTAFFVTNNLIYGNSTGINAIIPYTYSAPTGSGIEISSNTIANNTDIQVDLDYFPSQIDLINNILYSTSTFYAALVCGDYGYPLSAPAVVDHNDIYSTQGILPSSGCFASNSYGNIFSDPLFVNSSSNNYQLPANSPTVDAGNNSAPLMLATDIAGNPRLQDVSGLGYPVVDMGAYELAGNQDAAPTILSLSPSTYTPVTGSPITFTAVLTSIAGIPTGTVTIVQDGVAIGTVPVDATGHATFQYNIPTPGIHAYVATYSGNLAFPPAVSVKFYVLATGNPVPTLNLATAPEPSLYGNTFTLTATVTPASGTTTPTGSINFSIDSALVASSVALNAGTASYTVATGNTYATGIHTLSASYSGDTNFSTVSQSGSHTVEPLPSVISTVTASPEPSNWNDAFTLTATIDPSSSGTGTPTGTVTFYVDTTLVASNVPMSGDVATYVVPAGNAYAVRAHTLTAVYSGDTNFSGSTATGTHTIALDPTASLLTLNVPPSTVFSPDPETVYYGQDFNAQGSVAPTGSSALTGNILFYDNTALICTLPMTISTCATVNDSFDAGVHSMTAAYSGDAYNAPSTSPAAVLTILPDITTTSVVGTPNPAYYGQPVTFSVLSTGNYASPTGITDVADNLSGTLAQLVGAATLAPNTTGNTSSATVISSTLAVGTHIISANTPNMQDFDRSVSPPFPETILPDITTTTLTGAANPAVFGSAVTFTAVVTGNYAVPTGMVTFTDTLGGTVVTLGTGTLIPTGSGLAAVAVLTTSTLTVGTHPVTATLNASTDFQSSSSTAYPEVIFAAGPYASSLTLTSSLNPAGYGQTVTFTAAIALAPVGGVTPPIPAPPTGTVSFYDGAILLGTSAVNSSGAATFNTATLAVGGHNMTTVYAGDANYLGATSNLLIEIIHVVYTGPADFTLTIAQNPFPVGVGLTSSVAVTVVATNGWTSDVALACPAQLPYDFTCTLQQSTIAGGNGNTTLTLTTVAPHNCGNNPPYFTGTAQLELRMGAAALAGLVMLVIPRRKRLLKALLLALLCVLPGIAGCAGNCTDLGTRPGTYSIPITGTGVGTTTSHTVNLQVEVKL